MATRKFTAAEGDTIKLNAKNGVLEMKVGRIRKPWFKPATVELILSGTGVHD